MLLIFPRIPPSIHIGSLDALTAELARLLGISLPPLEIALGPVMDGVKDASPETHAPGHREEVSPLD